MSSPLDSTGVTPASYVRTGSSAPLAVQGRLLVEGLNPFMVAKNTTGLADFLRQADWSESALIAFLTCNDLAIIRAATWSLAHVGSMAANLPLATILHHDDPATVDLAENALWSIWLRSAPGNLHKRLCDAIRLTEQDCLDQALAEMGRILQAAPDYPEAFNQRAIVHFLRSDYPGAIADYQHAVALNPVHFGALAGLGHCCAALGRYADALNMYRRVLAVHPRMEGIRQAIGQIKRMIGTSASQSGQLPSFWAFS